MSPQKRIQHLRSKNKLLLDRLESHSSRIEDELKSLKRTIRGTSDKSPSCNDSRLKNWVKRNNSLQVSEALSSCTKSKNVGVSYKYSLTSCGENPEYTDVECEEDVNRVIEKSVSACHPPGKEKRTTCCRVKLIHRRKSGEDVASQNSKSIREIISLIDYSPKSTFVKRMKSKCKPHTREVYVRLAKEIGEPISNFNREKEDKKKKKKRQTRGLGETQVQKERNSDLEDPQTSYKNSLCSQCGKVIERQPLSCTSEDGSSESEELSKCGRVSKENEELERLKNFRKSNWQDCHADPSKCHPDHCCEHHKCDKVYGINDRLFAVPLDQGCENTVHCSSCPHFKSQKSCCSNSKKVTVSIPTSLLERGDLDTNKGKHLKRAKENNPVSKELLKKLQRPVPQNSMALRYQKGICEETF